MEEKSYLEDLKETFQGLGILLVIALIVWAITAATGNNEPETYSPPREPTKEEVAQWTKEYYENGNTDPDIDISQQYGGK